MTRRRVLSELCAVPSRLRCQGESEQKSDLTSSSRDDLSLFVLSHKIEDAGIEYRAERVLNRIHVMKRAAGDQVLTAIVRTLQRDTV